MNKIDNLPLLTGPCPPNCLGVRNSALGRGLGDLMERRPLETSALATPAAETKPRPAGVHIFLKPGSAEATAAATKVAEQGSSASRRPSTTIIAALVLADAVLCLLAWALVAKGRGTLSWGTWGLVGLAVALGAWLSVLAVRSRTSVLPAREYKPARINGGD